MSDIRNPAPPANAFTHRFEVLPSDIDMLGHAGNVSWVRWINQLATAHSESIGLDLDAYRALGVLWVVRRHEVDYLGQAFEGEKLEALTWVETLRGATSLRRTLIMRAEDGALLCRAATTWVLLDIASGRPRRIPRELLERYGFNG